MEVYEINDAKFGAMLNSLRVVDPEMVCPSGKKITRICSNPQCKVALNCGQFKCESCGGKVHKYCQSFSIDLMTELLNDRAEQSKEFIQKIRQMDSLLIKSINESQKDLTSKYKVSAIPQKIQSLVDMIYKSQNPDSVSGADGKYLFEEMQEINNALNSKILRLVQKYKKAIDKIVAEVVFLKRQLYSGELLVSKITIKEQKKETRPQIQEEEMKIKSSILHQNNPKSKEFTELLNHALDRPKELLLLYRGSENNFSAAAFHQKCGDKPNTLTLVQTQFQRTIAAFTPYSWHSVPNNRYVSNSKGGCFIIALENKEILVPLQTNHLIKNSSDYGPMFGCGSDLYISDLCNTKRSSYAGSIATYNTADHKFQNSQNAYTAISGATDGCSFRVLEYEVFQVLR